MSGVDKTFLGAALHIPLLCSASIVGSAVQVIDLAVLGDSTSVRSGAGAGAATIKSLLVTGSVGITGIADISGTTDLEV